MMSRMLGLGSKPITLFRVRGIPVNVTGPWILFFFLVTFLFARFYGQLLLEGSLASAPLALGALTAIGLFASIFLHELGHAVGALRNGTGVAFIQLDAFGGKMLNEREPDNPLSSLQVTAGGPLVTFAIVVVLSAIGLAAAGPSGIFGALTVRAGSGVSGALVIVSWLAVLNLGLLLMNLLPAYPLDGGRMVMAIAWQRTGDRDLATSLAVDLGRAIGCLVVVCGVALIVLTGGILVGLFLAISGLMVGGRAQLASVGVAMRRRIDHLQVADAMDRQPVTISGDLSVEQALECFSRSRCDRIPVVDDANRFVGFVLRDRAEEVPEASRMDVRVSGLVERGDDTVQIRDDAPFSSLLGSRALGRLGSLMVVDADGRLSGVVTRDQAYEAYRDAARGDQALSLA